MTKFLFTMFLLSLLTTCGKNKTEYPDLDLSNGEAEAVKVIFDTDMCFDVDDVGALSVLHYYADQGRADILGVCFNEVHQYGAAAIDAINTWYGRADIPIGIYKDKLSDPDGSRFLKPAAAYPHDTPEDLSKVPSAVDVYMKALSSAPDGSVVIISVGFLNNLADLLERDEELIKKKVKKLVLMGGINGDDFNFTRHNLASDTQKVFENWPTPMVVSQLGGDVMTGACLEDAPDSPIRTSFYKWFSDSYKNRCSWDEIAVMYAVTGTALFEESYDGYGSLSNGYRYKMSKNWRYFIKPKHSSKEYGDMIDNMMMQKPKNR